jgi:hypothetical protein
MGDNIEIVIHKKAAKERTHCIKALTKAILGRRSKEEEKSAIYFVIFSLSVEKRRNSIC